MAFQRALPEAIADAGFADAEQLHDPVRR